MKRALIALMMVFSLVVTPLMIESVDAHDMEMASAHCMNDSDSTPDQKSNSPLHDAHHCCGHSTAIGFTSSASLRVVMSIRSNQPLSDQHFSSAYQPGPLLEPPSHV